MKQINLNLFGYTYTGLAGFGQTIHDGFIAQIADYPTPAITMAILQTDVDDLNIAIAVWGVKGNRGSHNDHLALIAQRTVVRNDLRVLAFDAMKTMPDNPDSWSLVGFRIKRDKSKPQKLKMVQGFHNVISDDLANSDIKLRWKRPLDTQRGDVKGYIVQRNNVAIYPVSPDGHAVINVIGIIPNTAFIDADPYVGENYYWVTPYNTLGNGKTSEAVKVVSNKAKP